MTADYWGSMTALLSCWGEGRCSLSPSSITPPSGPEYWDTSSRPTSR